MRKQSLSSSKPSAIEAARDYGVDIDMLKANLRRSPAERIRRHDAALLMIRALQHGMRQHHG